MDLAQEDERLSHEGVHHLNAEGLQEEGLEPDQCRATAGVENQAGKNQRTEVGAQSVCWWILLVGKCAVSGPGGVSRIKLVSEAVRPLSTVMLVSRSWSQIIFSPIHLSPRPSTVPVLFQHDDANTGAWKLQRVFPECLNLSDKPSEFLP